MWNQLQNGSANSSACCCCCCTALAWRSSDATPAAVTTTRRYVFKVYICVSIHEWASVCMYESHGLVCIRLPHVYMYVFTYACKYLYTYICTHICVCVCISVCLHVHSIHTRYTRKRVLENCARFNPQHETRPFCTTTTTTRTHRARRVVTARQPCVAFAFCFCSWRARTYTIQNCCLCVYVYHVMHTTRAHTTHTHKKIHRLVAVQWTHGVTEVSWHPIGCSLWLSFYCKLRSVPGCVCMRVHINEQERARMYWEMCTTANRVCTRALLPIGSRAESTN